MSFRKLFEKQNWNTLKEEIYKISEREVQEVLSQEKINLEGFKKLISPAAESFLELIAKKSWRLTKKRFGNTMQMFIPMYLSNECENICTYCGFSMENKIRRKTLKNEEIIKEALHLKSLGYEHILLVTGESSRRVGVDYIKNAIHLIQPYFANISIEVQPLTEKEYAFLLKSGIHGVLVYQETYNKKTYQKHHPKGKKSDFNYRLETPDRIGKTGMHKIGLGALLGLEDWRVDSFFTALHLKYLQKKYWKTRYSISFPRLRPHIGNITPKVCMNDKNLVQLICAYRLLDENVELSISTREPPNFRDHIVHLGITSMSAESKTNPGGYTVDKQSLEQFEISDERNTSEIKKMLIEKNIEPVWKDWDKCLLP